MLTTSLGRLLVEEGLLSEADRATISKTCGQGPWAFARGVLALGLLDEEELTAVIADGTQYKIASRDLLSEHEPSVFQSVDPALISKLEVFPLHIIGNILTVAAADPLDRNILNQLEFFTGLRIKPIIAPLSLIRKCLGQVIDGYEPSLTELEEFIYNHAENATRFRTLQSKPFLRRRGRAHEHGAKASGKQLPGEYTSSKSDDRFVDVDIGPEMRRTRKRDDDLASLDDFGVGRHNPILPEKDSQTSGATVVDDDLNIADASDFDDEAEPLENLDGSTNDGDEVDFDAEEGGFDDPMSSDSSSSLAASEQMEDLSDLDNADIDGSDDDLSDDAFTLDSADDDGGMDLSDLDDIGEDGATADLGDLDDIGEDEKQAAEAGADLDLDLDDLGGEAVEAAGDGEADLDLDDLGGEAVEAAGEGEADLDLDDLGGEAVEAAGDGEADLDLDDLGGEAVEAAGEGEADLDLDDLGGEAVEAAGEGEADLDLDDLGGEAVEAAGDGEADLDLDLDDLGGEDVEAAADGEADLDLDDLGGEDVEAAGDGEADLDLDDLGGEADAPLNLSDEGDSELDLGDGSEAAAETEGDDLDIESLDAEGDPLASTDEDVDSDPLDSEELDTDTSLEEIGETDDIDDLGDLDSDSVDQVELSSEPGLDADLLSADASIENNEPSFDAEALPEDDSPSAEVSPKTTERKLDPATALADLNQALVRCSLLLPGSENSNLVQDTLSKYITESVVVASDGDSSVKAGWPESYLAADGSSLQDFAHALQDDFRVLKGSHSGAPSLINDWLSAGHTVLIIKSKVTLFGIVEPALAENQAFRLAASTLLRKIS